MKRTLYVLVCLLLLPASTWSQEVEETVWEDSSQETVTVNRSDLDAIMERLEELEAEVLKLKTGARSDTSATDDYTDPYPVSSPAIAPVRQSLLPDISVVGNIIGKTSNDRTDPDRNQVNMQELELAFQGYLYPQIRADAFIALGSDDGHQAALEEGYVTFLQLGNTNLNSKLGKKRLDFGKINKIHPHHWHFVDAPLVNRNFLSEDGIITQGAFVGYLLPPIGRMFNSVEAGVSRLSRDDYPGDAPFGPGFDGRVYSGRLWSSMAMQNGSELEFGASVAHGPGSALADVDSNQVTLSGLDLTYRMWPSAHTRYLLQAEAINQRRLGQSNLGYYVLGNYKWDKYWDFGLRYDWSARSYPNPGHDSGLSAMLTNRLTETMLMRLQLNRGNRANFGKLNEAFFQIVWGLGPHTHPLE